MSHPAPAAQAAAPIAPVTPEPLTYTYSTRNTFTTFAKFHGRNYFIWRRNTVTQPHAYGQWEVVDSSVIEPIPTDTVNPTPEEVCDLNTWNLFTARAYAEIVLQFEDNYRETITIINDPHHAWVTLESRYGSQQSGIQAVMNAKLTLARWSGRNPVMAHRNHM